MHAKNTSTCRKGASLSIKAMAEITYAPINPTFLIFTFACQHDPVFSCKRPQMSKLILTKY